MAIPGRYLEDELSRENSSFSSFGGFHETASSETRRTDSETIRTGSATSRTGSATSRTQNGIIGLMRAKLIAGDITPRSSFLLLTAITSSHSSSTSTSGSSFVSTLKNESCYFFSSLLTFIAAIIRIHLRSRSFVECRLHAGHVNVSTFH
jgi:hypothetical protein